MATGVTSTRLVGRSLELAQLQAALADAAAGQPSLAFVVGESGVGKSRLVAELEARAAADGTRVLSGECVELGEGELAYAPLVTALRPLVRDEDPVLAELPPGIRAELATLLPGLGEARERARGAGDQARVFEALLAVLDGLSRSAPVLLVIEDLHWADASTRAFLRFLSSTLGDEPLLLVTTYRPDELHRRHPLRPLLAELERVRAVRIDLAALTRDELQEQLAGILGTDPEPALVDRLFARSEGNPLFTEELLAAGLDGLGAVPPSLAAALALRIERLGDDAQEVVRVLSAGGQLDDAVLAEVAGLERRALREGLREAVASQIVVLDGERYTLRHALLREAVHDELLPGERAELHRALARALEAQASGAGPPTAQRAAAVAHHYFAAGDQPAALAAAVRAGVAAMEVQAYREGGALFERALELWDRVPGAAELAGTDQVELLERAAVLPVLLRRARPLRHAREARAGARRRGGRAAPRRLALRRAPALALVDAATRRGQRRARARAGAARRRQPESRARRTALPQRADPDAPVALPPRRERRAARAARAGAARGPGRLPGRRGRRAERARRLARGDRRGGGGLRRAATRAGDGLRARPSPGRRGRRREPQRGAAPRRAHERGARGRARRARGARARCRRGSCGSRSRSRSTRSTRATGTRPRRRWPASCGAGSRAATPS